MSRRRTIRALWITSLTIGIALRRSHPVFELVFVALAGLGATFDEPGHDDG
jgi:hypothetical protein